MRIRQFQHFIDEQERRTVRHQFHNAVDIEYRFFVNVNIRYVFLFLKFPLAVQFLCKLGIYEMPWLIRDYFPFNFNAYQRQIAHHIQQFMPCSFVREVKRQIIQNTVRTNGHLIFAKSIFQFLRGFRRQVFIYINNCVGNIAAFNQAGVQQHFQFVQERECARRCDLIFEFRNIFQCCVLCTQNFGTEIHHGGDFIIL